MAQVSGRASTAARRWTRLLGSGLLSVALLSLTGAAAAQALTPVEPRNIVQLSASGSVEAQQDWLTVTLSGTREGEDAAAVQNALRLALDAALAELKKAAQPTAMEVRSGGFNLQPRYGKDGKINGWQGSAELVLEGSDFARIGTAAARAQPMAISSLRFGLSRQARTLLEGQAQALAIASFKSKAGDIARGFGFTDYSLREINVGTAEQPIGPAPRMMAMGARAMAADAPVPMESGKSLVLVNVSGAVQLK
jgi:predicted secreted protein